MVSRNFYVMSELIREDRVYGINELPELKSDSFHYGNKIGYTGSIIKRAVPNTLNAFTHYGLIYGFDRNNVLWIIENNINGVECVTLKDFLRGQSHYTVECNVNPFKKILILIRVKEIASLKYHARFNNCEHFVNYCITGNKNSDQVTKSELLVNLLISALEIRVNITSQNSELLESFNKLRNSINIERLPEFQAALDKMNDINKQVDTP